MVWRRRAPAKVNLQLRVLGRRPDGYHELATCLHALDLADDLTLRLGGDGVRLAITSECGTGLPVEAGAANLVQRAAAAFAAAAGIPDGLRFALTKRIPAGAGLGGGSSDAAAALLLLQEAFGAPLAAAALHRTAAALGADVPFFLNAGTQIGTGRGDDLVAVAAAPHFHFVLIMPPFGTSTAAVYQRCRAAPLVEHGLTGPRSATTIPDRVAVGFELTRPDRFVNDLEAAAMAVEPRLGVLRNRVVEFGYPEVRMSGSGSTLFLAFREPERAAAALADLAPLRADGVALLATQSATSSRVGGADPRVQRGRRQSDPDARGGPGGPDRDVREPGGDP